MKHCPVDGSNLHSLGDHLLYISLPTAIICGVFGGLIAAVIVLLWGII